MGEPPSQKSKDTKKGGANKKKRDQTPLHTLSAINRLGAWTK